jgi:hypothetical protein
MAFLLVPVTGKAFSDLPLVQTEVLNLLSLLDGRVGPRPKLVYNARKLSNIKILLQNCKQIGETDGFSLESFRPY